ncbi:DJ-1/PfpI family protein [Butyrivibrio sp. CB08]|uniref:DJ-1/PfpI family protein n=1 Tax=Butyrivibrio sp. CB08 TaxID=2364879 RepID=UPI000EAAC25F|nr:DJ-1/PfpI family protein [Butyrivibrio sp. CB08]RKM61243.1 DJ-1/PfpI family protein [Butyrivibrio sp. CB08]
MKVLLFCCKGFETMEFAPFLDACGWARDDFHNDINVVTAGFTKTVVSTFGVPVIVDKLFDEIDASDFDALAIPGGYEEYGFYEDGYKPEFLDLIRKFDEAGKPIASICVGALPIAASGVLKGRNATTYHLGSGIRQKQLAEFGVNVIPDQRIVVDKNIVTSFCPETAADVAFTLLELLLGKEMSKTVSAAMGY